MEDVEYFFPIVDVFLFVMRGVQPCEYKINQVVVIEFFDIVGEAAEQTIVIFEDLRDQFLNTDIFEDILHDNRDVFVGC